MPTLKREIEREVVLRRYENKGAERTREFKEEEEKGKTERENGRERERVRNGIKRQKRRERERKCDKCTIETSTIPIFMIVVE